MSFFRKKEETVKGFKFNFSLDKKNSTNTKPSVSVATSNFLKLQDTKEEPKTISNITAIKVSAPEKRIKLEKPVNLDESMPPPPPVVKPSQKEEQETSQDIISTIQSEVEKKLELQHESNRDVMETVTVNANNL